MTDSGHTVRGIVVEHKENGKRYAVSPPNFNPKIHTRIRELFPGETVRGYLPRSKEPIAPIPQDLPKRRFNKTSPSPDGDTKAPSPEGTEDTIERKD